MRKKQQDSPSAETDSKRIRKQPADAPVPPVENLLHELQVNQYELEIQNEELLQSRNLLEESRDRYVDFYDFAPVAYLTLSHKALIAEINLTGAAMLGEEPGQLRHRRFAEFIAPEDNDLWNRHFMAARRQDGKLTCELRIQPGNGTRLHVQVDSLCLEKDGHEPVVRIALTDITELKLAEVALRESEAQLRLLEQREIVQTSLDGFFVVDTKNARITEVNDAFCRMTGYSRTELLVMSISGLDVIESPAETAAHIKKIMAIGYDRFESRYRHKHGRLFDVEVSVSYSELDGGVNHVFVRDITERKLAEKYEQFRSHTLELLAGGAPLPHVLEGIVRGVEQLDSGMICSILLLDSQGKHLVEGIAPSLPDFYNAAIDGLGIGIGAGSCGTAAFTGERVIVEDIKTHPYWASFRELAASAGLRACWSEPIRSSSGQVLGSFAIYHREVHAPTESAISLIEKSANLASIAIERKRAEDALRRSEAEFRTLAENLPDVLIRYDREGRRTYVNPATEQIFAVTGKEMIGLTPQEADPLNLPEIYRLALKHTLATGERSVFEMELPSPSGKVRTGLICIVAENAADGQISGAITIGRDISEIKQAERQLRELAMHIQTVREEEKAHLAREIHDELGSALAALKIEVFMLERGLSARQKKMPLYARVESMAALLDNVYEATRRIITDLRPPQLDDLGLLAALKWQAEQFNKLTGIECRVACIHSEVCEGCIACEGKFDSKFDEAISITLFRIFQEALANVARHSGASTVVAEFNPTDSEVVLSIRDNGRGLPEGHAIAPTSYGMRGMRERVEQLNGKIKFDSPPCGGLTVLVKLPQPPETKMKNLVP